MVKDRCNWSGDKGCTKFCDEYKRELVIIYYSRSGMVYSGVDGNLAFLIQDNLIKNLPINDVKEYVETQIQLFIDTIT